MLIHVDVPIAIGAAALLLTAFGRFEVGVPMAKRVARMGIYLLPALVIALVAGPPWTYFWLIGAALPGLCFHVVWCLRHGINLLTSEPRDKYLALRGWDQK